MPRRSRKQSRAAGLARRRWRGAMAILLVLLACGAILGVYGWLAVVRLLSPYKPASAEHVMVTIPPGTGSGGIARILAAHGVVRSPFAFLLALRLSGGGRIIRADRYDLSPSMSPRQIVEAIESGAASASDWISVPEGFTARQIAQRLAAKKLADGAAFLAAVRSDGRTIRFADGFVAPADDLEGYLFPDTYRVPAGATVPGLLRDMVGEFDTKVVRTHPQVTDWRKTIILASLVEREAKVAKDRPLIASVMNNRLRLGMPLDIDASIEYALPAHKSRLHYSDLQTPSLYNTYLHKGLPPTPICNPGLPSIEAVLHPAKTDYLYYVAGPAGAHIFSRTLAEQDKTIARLHKIGEHGYNGNAQ